MTSRKPSNSGNDDKHANASLQIDTGTQSILAKKLSLALSQTSRRPSNLIHNSSIAINDALKSPGVSPLQQGQTSGYVRQRRYSCQEPDSAESAIIDLGSTIKSAIIGSTIKSAIPVGLDIGGDLAYANNRCRLSNVSLSPPKAPGSGRSRKVSTSSFSHESQTGEATEAYAKPSDPVWADFPMAVTLPTPTDNIAPNFPGFEDVYGIKEFKDISSSGMNIMEIIVGEINQTMPLVYKRIKSIIDENKSLENYEKNLFRHRAKSWPLVRSVPDSLSRRLLRLSEGMLEPDSETLMYSSLARSYLSILQMMLYEQKRAIKSSSYLTDWITQLMVVYAPLVRLVDSLVKEFLTQQNFKEKVNLVKPVESQKKLDTSSPIPSREPSTKKPRKKSWWTSTDSLNHTSSRKASASSLSTFLRSVHSTISRRVSMMDQAQEFDSASVSTNASSDLISGKTNTDSLFKTSGDMSTPKKTESPLLLIESDNLKKTICRVCEMSVPVATLTQHSKICVQKQDIISQNEACDEKLDKYCSIMKKMKRSTETPEMQKAILDYIVEKVEKVLGPHKWSANKIKATLAALAKYEPKISKRISSIKIVEQSVAIEVMNLALTTVHLF